MLCSFVDMILGGKEIMLLIIINYENEMKTDDKCCRLKYYIRKINEKDKNILNLGTDIEFD